MAISTYGIQLMKKSGTSGSTYTKVVDIKDFPNLGGSPEMLETTTLSDNMQTFILGIQRLDALEFTANYTKTDYSTLKALENTETDYAVWLGNDKTGSDGKFQFRGKLSVYPVGGDVNKVVDMKITIAPSTVITLASN